LKSQKGDFIDVEKNNSEHATLPVTEGTLNYKGKLRWRAG
jgi:hypothetical protein